MYQFEGDSIDNLLREALQKIMEVGAKVNSSKGPNTEIRGVNFKLTNPRYRLSASVIRGKAYSPFGELFWYLSGKDDLKHIEYYIKKYRDYSDNGETLYGAYGKRIFDNNANQFKNAFEKLKSSPHTKHAIIQIFKPEDIFTNTKDLPCTICLQFFIRDNKLELYTMMRSNDVIMGFTHDVFCFTFIQEIMARKLGCELGTYNHYVTSLHLYDDSKKKAINYLKEGQYPSKYEMPEMPGENIDDFLIACIKIEEEIRLSKEYNEIRQMTFDDLTPYWKDIILMLMAFKYSKIKKLDEVEKIASLFSNKYYKTFIQDRLISRTFKNA